MNKKNKLALLILLCVGLFSLSTSNNFAQKTDVEQTKNANSELRVWQKYIEVSSLPLEKRAKAFSDLSKEMKSEVFRFHLAMQFVKRPNLNKEQKDFILEALSGISADDYDLTKDRATVESKLQTIEARSKLLFSGKEFFEIFTNISSSENDLAVLKKYQNLVSYNTVVERNKNFRELSPEDKTLIWQSKFTLYLATQDFDKQQQDFILEGIAMLSTGKIYSVNSKNESVRLLDEFEKKAIKLFSKEQVFKLFMTLGGESTCSLASSTTNSQTTEESGVECTCRFAEWCQWAYTPLSSCRRGCDETPTGCGVLLNSPCIGTCQLFNPN